MLRLNLVQLWRREFNNYTFDLFRRDLLAGLTVAAVALPLALAFGVVSGASAAAGLITAILSGILIGGLSGAPYQISGPTGAMSAILLVISARYGLEGVWMTGVIAGGVILLIGILRLGRFIAFIPAPVISGFTSGIAVIIFVGQIDNLLGVTTTSAETSAGKIMVYLSERYWPDWHTVLIGVVVMAVMLFWSKRWQRLLPGSLAGIILATLIVVATGWQLPSIGEIPRTVVLEQRLQFVLPPWSELRPFLMPALSIAALGAVESLLCGAVASKMTGVRLHANQELVAQGIGNLIIPFFGGVPATAAIARTSVGIRSGGQTRMVSIIHSLALLASALLFGPIISRIPLTALAGVLMVTAYRMNEWPAIRFIFQNRFKSGIVTYLITLVATITLDLTQAILIGAALSAVIFINQVSALQVDVRNVDVEKIRKLGWNLRGDGSRIRVAYLTGPLFFAATSTFNEAFAHEEDVDTLILSMRAVPLVDISGLEALETLLHQLQGAGKTLLLASVQPAVLRMFERCGLDVAIGQENIFWSADQAILHAERRLFPEGEEVEQDHSSLTAQTVMPQSTLPL